MSADKIRPRQSGRDVGLNELRGRDVTGIYVLIVPKAVKSYYKIGTSESDLEKRVGSYITAYPWDFNVVAIMVYDLKLSNHLRYLKVRQAEKDIIKAFPKERYGKVKSR